MGDRQLQRHRLTIALLAVIVILLALLGIILAWAAPEAAINRIYDGADFLADHNNRDGKIVFTLVAVVVILIMVCVLIVELVPSSNQLKVGGVEAGVVAITTAQIAQRIEGEVAGVEHVSAGRATVARRGQRVEVVLDLDVDAGANLSAVANEACRRAHELVERKLKIELAAKPRARIHYRELRLVDTGGQERPVTTGWERPEAEEARDDRRSVDANDGRADERADEWAPEEAQA